MRKILTADKVKALARRPENFTSADGGGQSFRKKKLPLFRTVSMSPIKDCTIADTGPGSPILRTTGMRETPRAGPNLREQLSIELLFDGTLDVGPKATLVERIQRLPGVTQVVLDSADDRKLTVRSRSGSLSAITLLDQLSQYGFDASVTTVDKATGIAASDTRTVAGSQADR